MTSPRVILVIGFYELLALTWTQSSLRSPADEKGDGEGTPPSREFLNLFNTYLLSIFHMLSIVLDAGDSAMQKTFKQKSLPVRSVYPVGGTEKLSR